MGTLGDRSGDENASTWFGVGFTVEPTFEEFSLICNPLLMSKPLDPF